MICGIAYGNTFNTSVNNTYRSTSVYISPGRGLTYGQNIQQETYRTPRIGYSTYRGQEHYGGVGYTPTSNGSGKPGIRKIRVYDGDGNAEDTPGGNSDNENWLYQQDADGTWWCSQDGGSTWKKWDSLWGWGLIGFSWREGRGDPTYNATHYHHDPNNPWVTPIGDPPYICLLLAIGFYIFKQRKRKTCC